MTTIDEAEYFDKLEVSHKRLLGALQLLVLAVTSSGAYQNHSQMSVDNAIVNARGCIHEAKEVLP